MDKRTILTIVVTAVISAAVTQVMNSGVGFARNLPITNRVRETAKKTLTKSFLGLLYYVLTFAASIWLFTTDMKKTGSPTRWDIVEIVFHLLLIAALSIIVPVKIGIMWSRRHSATATQQRP